MVIFSINWATKYVIAWRGGRTARGKNRSGEASLTKTTLFRSGHKREARHELHRGKEASGRGSGEQ